MFGTQQASGPLAQVGPELSEVATEGLGFQALAGETRIRLLPAPWPANNLPKPTANLLAIAQREGLVAAAGPDVLVIGNTLSVRNAFAANVPSDKNVKPFVAQLSLQVPRLSQVAFTSDEKWLVVSAEEAGGLTVYDVQALKQGNNQPAFQIETNRIPVRALIANPATEAAHLTAVVLSQGQLMVANLNTRSFESGPNGFILKDGVSCVSWSNKGKQLTAGLGNATALQMTPTGEVKAQLPAFPQLSGDLHVSGISWLDNDHWLVIYTPSAVSPDGGLDSVYVYISREKNTQNFGFQRFPDPCVPFGMNRSPSHHFLNRLREYPPNLTDVILLSSTCTGELGIFACSRIPMSSDSSAASTANQYAMMTIANDSRKAQLPADEQMIDTSPIGAVIDLSSRDNVPKPIPAEEIDASQTPLPGIAILNHEGILSYWWFVYSESVRNGQPYPGLVAMGKEQAPQPTSAPTSLGFASFARAPSAFAASSSTTSPFGQMHSQTSPLASPPSVASFGGTSAIGANKSAWGATNQTGPAQTGNSSFGKPAFGSSTTLGASGGFGSVGGIGRQQSVWGSSTTQETQVKPNPFSNSASTSPFSALNQSSQSPFGAMSSVNSGFANLSSSSKSPFTQTGQHTSAAGSANQPSFGSSMTIGSNLSGGSFGASTLGESKSTWGTHSLSKNSLAKAEDDMDDAMESETPREKDMAEQQQGIGSFGKALDTLKLGTTKSNQDSVTENAKSPGQSLFSSNFGKALEDTRGEATDTVANSEKAFDGKYIKEESQDDAPLPPSPKPIPSDAPLPPFPGETLPRASQSTFEPATTLPEPAPLPPSPKPEASQLVGAEPSHSAKVDAAKADPAPLPPLPNLTVPEPAPLPSSPVPTNGETMEKHSSFADGPISPAGSPPVDLGAAESFDTSPLSDSSIRGTDKEGEKQTPEPTKDSKTHAWDANSIAGSTPLAHRAQKMFETPHRNFDTTPSTVGKAAPPILSTTPLSPLARPYPSSLFQAAPRRGQSQSPNRSQQGQPEVMSKQPPTTPSFSTRGLADKHESAAPGLPNWKVGRDVKEGLRSSMTKPQQARDTDQYLAEELVAPILPTKRLASFLAHQDYVADVGGSDVPAQIEKVYRDINSMIDTLGLNCRSLQAWFAGHESFKDGGRTTEDLDSDPESWALIEIEDLGVVQKELIEVIDAERLKDVGSLLSTLADLRTDVTKLRQRNSSTQQAILSHKTSDGLSTNPTSPHIKTLDSEQHQTLISLRKAYGSLQTQLRNAENVLSILQAKLASSSRSEKRTSMPTVEAVLTTISKLTRMIEEKSGDLDLLESRVHQLDFVRKSKDKSLDAIMGVLSISQGSRENTPFRASPFDASKVNGGTLHTPQASGRFTLTYDASSDEDDTDQRNGHFKDDQVATHVQSVQHRQHVMNALKEAVLKRGVRQSVAM